MSTPEEKLSLALDFTFAGTAKGIYEGLSGKDLITQKELSRFDRTMCFVGSVPLVGPLAKGSSKAAKCVRTTAKAAKWIDRANLARKSVKVLESDV